MNLLYFKFLTYLLYIYFSPEINVIYTFSHRSTVQNYFIALTNILQFDTFYIFLKKQLQVKNLMEIL